MLPAFADGPRSNCMNIQQKKNFFFVSSKIMIIFAVSFLNADSPLGNHRRAGHVHTEGVF